MLELCIMLCIHNPTHGQYRQNKNVKTWNRGSLLLKADPLRVIHVEVCDPAELPARNVRGGDPDPEPAGGGAGGRGEVSCDWLTGC